MTPPITGCETATDENGFKKLFTDTRIQYKITWTDSHKESFHQELPITIEATIKANNLKEALKTFKEGYQQ